MHGEVVKVLQIPDTRAKLAGRGVSPAGISPDQFAAMIARDIEKMGKIIKAADVKLD